MKGLQISREVHLLTVKYGYSRPSGVSFLFVDLVFWCFTVAQITSVDDLGGSVLFIALSSGISYLALGYLLNSTNIEVSPQTMTVSHGPLPWPGGFHIPPALIKDCRLVEHSASKNRPRSWELRAQMRDGTSKTLISDIRIHDVANHISQQVESFLADLKRSAARKRQSSGCSGGES